MRTFSIGLLALAFLASTVMLITPAVSQDKQEKPTAHTFVGVAKCKTCHKTEAQGAQFPLWEKSPHAQAYATLGTEEAKAVAKEKGIEDPQKADECLRCHATGHGVESGLLAEGFDMTEGVGCESCHGAGGDYYKMATMKAIAKGEMDGASVGLMVADKDLCVKCHNEESPTFKGFDYEKMAPKIAHPIPAERKAQYKSE